MTETPIITDQMDYGNLTQNALRGVIRQALMRATRPGGLPGDHHFYITFQTRAEGVSIPDDLKARYPNEITIVLQHQYQDLKVEEDRVSVTLSFGNAPKVLRFPYAAITRFHDPSVQFVLEFEVEEVDTLQDNLSDSIDVIPVPKADSTSKPRDTDDSPDSGPTDSGPKVVSLDQFRKK